MVGLAIEYTRKAGLHCLDVDKLSTAWLSHTHKHAVRLMYTFLRKIYIPIDKVPMQQTWHALDKTKARIFC